MKQLTLKPVWALFAALSPLFIALSLLAGLAGGAGAQVYVSTTGSDAAAGTLAAPVQTVSQAQTIARQQGAAGIHIYLRGGTYPLAAPLALTAADSGETWTAFNGETPTLSGGILITGWTLHDSGKNIWQATVPASLDTRTLYVNGVRCFRAHSADASVLGTLTLTSTGYTSSGNSAASWGNQSAIELVYNTPGGYNGNTGYGSHWTEIRVPVQSMTGSAITMQTPGWYEARNNTLVVPSQTGTGNNDVADFPGIIENAYELLSAQTQGQFYLDKTAHILYYVPRPAENMASAQVIAPVQEAVVTTSSAANVTLSSLTFADTTWLEPNTANGFPELQTSVYFAYPQASASAPVPFGQFAVMPAAVRVSGGSGVQITRCTFQRLGAGGVSVQDGAANALVQGNVITDCSGYGVCLASVLDWKSAAPVNHCLVDDNVIHDVGVEYRGSAAITAFTAQNCTISHNLIYNVPYSGIAWGVGWVNPQTSPTVSADNVVADNHIYNVMQNRIDGGAIYVNSQNTGLAITGNLLHDQNIANSGLVLYLDNGNGPNTTLTGNCIYNCNNGGAFNGVAYQGNVWSYNFTEGSSVFSVFSQAGVATTDVVKETIGTAATNFPASVVSQAGLLPAFRALAPAAAQVTPLQADGRLAAAQAAPGLGAPGALSLGQISGNSVTLDWTAPPATAGTSIGGYDVLANGSVIGSTPVSALTWTYDDLAGGKPVSFTVRAWDTHGTLGAASPALAISPPSSLLARTSYPAYKL